MWKPIIVVSFTDKWFSRTSGCQTTKILLLCVKMADQREYAQVNNHTHTVQMQLYALHNQGSSADGWLNEGMHTGIHPIECVIRTLIYVRALVTDCIICKWFICMHYAWVRCVSGPGNKSTEPYSSVILCVLCCQCTVVHWVSVFQLVAQAFNILPLLMLV